MCVKRLSSVGMVFIVIFVYLFLAGCQDRQDVRVGDGHSTLVTGNVVVRPSSMQMWRGKLKGGIELAYEGQSGTGTQWLYSTQYVTFDQPDNHNVPFTQVTINGPQDLQNTARVDHGHVAYNLLFEATPHFELEPAIGLAYDKADITSTGQTSGMSVSTTQHSLGATISVTPRWKFNSWVAVESRFRFGFDTDSNYTTLINPAVNFTVKDTVSLSAGYAFRKQHFKTTHDTSDIYFSFDGPSVALRLKF